MDTESLYSGFFRGLVRHPAYKLAERQLFQNCGTQEETMKVSARKNRQLIKQYPFVQEILAFPMEPYGFERDLNLSFDGLTIRVQKADGNLMFRRADNIGLGDNGHSFHLEGPRKDQVSKRGEYIFAIDAHGKILNQVKWPRNREEQREQNWHPVYAWTVLWTGRTTFANGELGYKDPIWNKVEYLVWVTVKAWYKGTKDLDQPFGEFVDRSATVTIYGKPSVGFEKLQEQANVYDNLYLDSNTLMDGTLRKDHDIIVISGRLAELCRLFQDEVYFNGMKDVLDKGNARGASGTLGPVKILVGEMCGYDRVQIENDSSWVSLQLRPGGSNMYVLGAGGTLPQIRWLIKIAVKAWNEEPELRAAFKPDQKVSVL